MSVKKPKLRVVREPSDAEKRRGIFIRKLYSFTEVIIEMNARKYSKTAKENLVLISLECGVLLAQEMEDLYPGWIKRHIPMKGFEG